MGNVYSGEKPRDDPVVTPVKGTLPDISAATPKVSLFDFQQGVGPGELVKSCIEQTVKYGPIATQKVGFMALNQQTKDPTGSLKFTPTVILNATGVRLSLVSFKGLPDYPAPAVIEPGECASFLNVLNSGPQGLVQYEAQVFEGPFAGWLAPTGDILKIPVFKINVGSDPVSPSTAKARVQDKAGGAPTVVSTLTWTSKFTPSAEGSVFQYTLTQSLD